MWNAYPKPRWWRLYAILPLAVALLAIDSQLALPSLGHKLVEILIVIVTVGLMGLWVVANALALECSDAAEQAATDTVGDRRRGGVVARGRMGMSAPTAPIDTDALVRLRNN
jgi:hypothetical protein